MHTMNHRTLEMEGCGKSVILLTLRSRKLHLCLINCLHAPSAMVNLLSVGWMTMVDWKLWFQGEPGCCELYHLDEHLGDVPMHNNLCQLIVQFLPPPSAHLVSVPFVLFTPSKLTWDLWHAWLGHLGGTSPSCYPQLSQKLALMAHCLPLQVMHYC